MFETLKNWFIGQQFSETMAGYFSWLVLAIAYIIFAYVLNFIVKKILLQIVIFFIKRTKTTWDDALLHNRVFTRLSHLAPALILYGAAPLFPAIQDFIQRVAIVYMLLTGLLVIDGFLNAVVEIYCRFDVSRNKPIKSK